MSMQRRECTKKRCPNSRNTRNSTEALLPRSIGVLAYPHARLNERSQALQALKELRDLSKKRYVPSASFAIIYVGLGDKDQAFTWLEKAYEERSRLPMLKVDPIWDPLRADPRFRELVRRIGLPQ